MQDSSVSALECYKREELIRIEAKGNWIEDHKLKKWEWITEAKLNSQKSAAWKRN